ncbi:MAG TPA: FlgD immunoglobulin-like domain containing protein, partial [Candidatus Cloacimonadota bacterium]|nr:FlgD immunoglobulin-like domain containing protein [Candidatus Cloacimonadota bacterium]
NHTDDPSLWSTTEKLRNYNTGKELFFKYVFTDAEDRTYESFLDSYVVAGPDLFLRDIRFESNPLQLLVKSTNIGNAASGVTDLKLYVTPSGGTTSLFSTQSYAPLQMQEERWDTIALAGVPNANNTFLVQVNSANDFPEWHIYGNTNNNIQLEVPFNYHNIDSSGATINSVDNNLSCVIPPDFVPSGIQTGIAVNTLRAITSLNQPDIETIRLRSVDGLSNNIQSIPYDIRILDSTLTDSLGVFTGGKRISLTFYYDPMDPATQLYESENSYKIYRYNSEFQKWILHGGHVNTTANTVNFEVMREGIYTIFRNRDKLSPSVDVNVQDQEFTVGGYVAGDGVISLLLSDANGIDVIDDTIKLSMNGIAVAPDDFVISVNLENINRVPIKYQLALGKGSHELKVDCKDLNGNFTTRIVKFEVNDEFKLENIGNYPNPILGRAQDPKNDGRTRFTYVLTDTADEVNLKVYTISGRLVKTFDHLPVGVGYHEYPRTLYAWDCKDDEGYPLANGVYFYRIVARKGNKKIEKTMKMAILK